MLCKILGRKCGRGFLFFSLALAVGCGGGDQIGPEPTPEPDPTQKTADVSVNVSGPATAAPGADITYAITVANAAGGDPALEVVVTDSLPKGVVVASITDGGSEANGVVTWPAIASLAPGTTRTMRVTVTVALEGELRNVAFGTSVTMDPQEGNNNGTGDGVLVIASVASADVQVIHVSSGTANTGDTARITLTVRNAGPSTARGVVATDILPAGLTLTSISDGGIATNNTIQWPTIDSLVSGGSRAFTVDFVVPAIGPVLAVANAASTTGDPAPGNNAGGASGQVSLSVGFTPVMTITGESAGDQFGWLMDNVGDIDGDGANDYVVGAPTNGAGGTNAGRAYVYSGATGQLVYTFTGAPGQRFGTALDAAGDVNGDGVGDIVVGGPSAGSGRAVVYSGADGTVIWDLPGENAGDGFGTAVGRLGDTNGDGFDDFLVTAPGHDSGVSNSGRVYVISGVDGSTLATKNSLVGGQFGSSVGGVGDLTGDGVPDFGVGAPGATGSGRIYVLNGVTADTVFFSIPGDATGSALGQFWLNEMGDVNGDGIPDFYASDILNNANGAQTGRAYVFSGADGSKIHTMTGENPGDQFGIGRGIPDVDGDGISDLFLAGWLSSEGASLSGKAYVYSGATGKVVRNFVSTVASDNLGFDAIGLGDITGDGKPDFLISGGISNLTPGQVHVVAGI